MDPVSSEPQTLHEILRKKYNWSHLAFVNGMAPLDTKNGKPFWKPKIKLLKSLLGGSNGPRVNIDLVLGPGTLLKFTIPNEVTQNTFDYQNWRGFFDREARYTNETEGMVLDRWLIFESFHSNGFEFSVRYQGSEVQVYLPSIVLFGAEWILVAE